MVIYFCYVKLYNNSLHKTCMMCYNLLSHCGMNWIKYLYCEYIRVNGYSEYNPIDMSHFRIHNVSQFCSQNFTIKASKAHTSVRYIFSVSLSVCKGRYITLLIA